MAGGGLAGGVMELIVICAQCSEEFKADGDERFWKCSGCGHEVENMKYPFLTRKIAHAKAHRSETNWEAMFDELLADARTKVLDLEARAKRGALAAEKTGGRKPPAP
jgi:DNA-directed RNA polymerase subunit RPC12/RpoP